MNLIKSFAAAIAAVTIAGSALAADLPSRNAPPVAYAPLPAMTWAGFYIGVNGGYVFSDRNRMALVGAGPLLTGLAGIGVVPSFIPSKREGFIGGGQMGYNWQFGSIVLGLETDIQGVAAQSKGGVLVGTIAGPIVTKAQSKLDYLGTVRGRFGFTVAPTVLLYATGGLAYGGVRQSVQSYAAAFAPGNGVFASSTSSTKVGYTAGAGVEWAFAPAWSVEFEYMYYNLGSSRSLAPDVTGNFPTEYLVYSRRNDGHVARAGVNYRFWSSPASVVARY